MLPVQQSLNNSACRSNSIVRLFYEEERSHLNKNTKGEDKIGHVSVQKNNKSNSLQQHFKSIPSGLLTYDKLIVIRDRKAVCQFEFRSKRAEIVIGSHPLANIVLDAPKVSKFHARIICRNGVYYLQDLDSAYGTFLNGKKIPSNLSIVIQNTDSLRIMAFQLCFEIQEKTGVKNSLSINPVILPEQIKLKPSVDDESTDSAKFLPSSDSLQSLIPDSKTTVELSVTEIIIEADNVKTFRLTGDKSSAFSYLPGQFITLILSINGQRVQRCYSMSSSPSRPNTLEITIKRVPGGLVSNWLCDTVKEGDKLKMKKPRGNFCHLSRPSKKLLFIGAGSGVTPLMSMIRWQFDSASDIDCKALFSFSKYDDLLFGKEIEWINHLSKMIDIAVTLTKLECSAQTDWIGFKERINSRILTSFILDLHERDVYLCGSEGFMDTVKDLLASLNFPTAQLYCESFARLEKPLPHREHRVSTVSKKQSELNESEKMTVHSVTFAKSNKMIQVDETTSLLVASEAEGIDIDSSCRTGTCAECMIKCLSGQVSIDEQCEIDAQEREQGWIFSCCTYAQSDLVIDA